MRTIFNNKLNKAFHTSEENDYFDSSTFKPGAAVDKANQIIEDVYATGKDKGHVPYYWSSEKFLSDLQVYKAMDDYKWSREELTTYARIIITLVNLGLNGKEGYEYSGRTQEAIGYALAGATTDVIADKVGYVDPSDWSIPIYWITQNIGEFFSGRKATKAKEAIRYYLYVSKTFRKYQLDEYATMRSANIMQNGFLGKRNKGLGKRFNEDLVAAGEVYLEELRLKVGIKYIFLQDYVDIFNGRISELKKINDPSSGQFNYGNPYVSDEEVDRYFWDLLQAEEIVHPVDKKP